MIRLSLRQKLLLVSSLILVVPWLGIRYVKAIEDYLQHIILDNLTAYAQSVSANITLQSDVIPTFPSGESIYAAPLPNEPSLDGYDADWGDFSQSELMLLDNSNASNSSLKVGRFSDSLYLFVSVRDRDIRYNQSSFSLSDSQEVDGIAIELSIGEQQKQLLLITEAPGRVYARDAKTGQRYSRIQGMWQEREQGVGYEVEFKIPVTYVQQGLNILVNDYVANKTHQYQLGQQPVSVLSAPDKLNDLINQFGLVDGRRLRLLDNEGRLLASSGSLSVQQNLKPINPLFAWLLIPNEIVDTDSQTNFLQRADVQSALNGKAYSLRTRQQGGNTMLLSSAWPISQADDGTLKGVVLLEESTAALQVLQRSALASLLNVSLIIFVLLAVALIAFAGRLSNRIRQLEKITDSAIDEYGRVKGEPPELKQGDELDDLNNHVHDMLVRLRAYHDYLEKLASRLSHEIRTPVAVVRSSLENIQQQISNDEDSQLQGNLTRAEQGVKRLQTLLHRMAEASRLEQSIHESSREELDLDRFLKQVIAGYESVYESHQFKYKTDISTISASADLLSQALDKLINNAVSFAEKRSVIKVIVTSKNNSVRLSVQNVGPQLPAGMESQLFQSMVSIREKDNHEEQPHLGLGLHIVQLVAEFHSGQPFAANIKEGVSIGFTIKR